MRDDDEALLPSAVTQPAVLLFRLGDSPFIRTTLLPLYPLPESFLSLAFWIHRADCDPGRGIFDALPEKEVDPKHHQHAWAMLVDTHRMMMADRGLRVRVRGDESHGRNTIGYHTSGRYEDVAAYFARSMEVLHLRDEVTKRLAERDDDEDIRRALEHNLGIGRDASLLRERLYDALVGDGDLRKLSRRVPFSVIQGLFWRQPSRFTALDDRVLGLVATNPRLLAESDFRLHIQDPLLDQHAIWREKLLARGATEEAIERAVMANFHTTEQVTSRAWWVLGRAAAEPAAFLDRHRALGHFATIVRRLFFAALVTWDLPAFHTLADTLLRDHLDDVPFEAFDNLQQLAGQPDKEATRKRVSTTLHAHEAALLARFGDKAVALLAGVGKP